MLYRALQRKDDEPGLDMTYLPAFAPSGLGRLRSFFRRLPFFAYDQGRPRRAIERELEDLYHPFD